MIFEKREILAGTNHIAPNLCIVWLKPFGLVYFIRPINGTAMNQSIIAVGFSQRVMRP